MSNICLTPSTGDVVLGMPVSRARNSLIPGWLTTNAAIDLPRLRAILTNWVASVCPEG